MKEKLLGVVVTGLLVWSGCGGGSGEAADGGGAADGAIADAGLPDAPGRPDAVPVNYLPADFEVILPGGADVFVRGATWTGSRFGVLTRPKILVVDAEGASYEGPDMQPDPSDIREVLRIGPKTVAVLSERGFDPTQRLELYSDTMESLGRIDLETEPTSRDCHAASASDGVAYVQNVINRDGPEPFGLRLHRVVVGEPEMVRDVSLESGLFVPEGPGVVLENGHLAFCGTVDVPAPSPGLAIIEPDSGAMELKVIGDARNAVSPRCHVLREGEDVVAVWSEDRDEHVWALRRLSPTGAPEGEVLRAPSSGSLLGALVAKRQVVVFSQLAGELHLARYSLEQEKWLTPTQVDTQTTQDIFGAAMGTDGEALYVGYVRNPEDVFEPMYPVVTRLQLPDW